MSQWPPCWESYREDYEMDIDPEPEITPDTVALARSIKELHIDEAGPCHIVLEDFNVYDHNLAYAALECATPSLDWCKGDSICEESRKSDALVCAGVLRQLLEMTEQQRFAVVLMAGGCLPMEAQYPSRSINA